ncbi:spore germination protein [Aureibacillus halotolerans]|uniref:Spore germination protein PA n=1 Tax=Aureibacillus halotolerans TaxID=1508390 RepID=A0A4R6UG06_9BACI|nr:spore germination protein [Aureibacillus halotolerans]TDQ42074.1 spore germination protein PA [Aureibacillus halotolerans]
MPAIIGAIKITTVGGGSGVIFGDTFYVSPKHSSKSSSGAASNVTGDFTIQNSLFSIVSTIDPDVADQNNVANA